MGRTTRLNPLTNDPYINKEGKLEVASDKEELKQKFDVLVHTKAGSLPMNVEYGIDFEWIRNQWFSEPDMAFFMELANRIEKKVEPIISNFDVDYVEQWDNSIIVACTIRSTTGKTVTSNVKIS